MDKYVGRFIFDCVAIVLLSLIVSWAVCPAAVPYVAVVTAFGVVCRRLDDIARKLDNGKKE